MQNYADMLQSNKNKLQYNRVNIFTKNFFLLFGKNIYFIFISRSENTQKQNTDHEASRF